MVDVLDVQGHLVVVERCLEGTEEVTNPSDVEYAVDDVHHSSNGVVHVYLVHDVLLSLDVGLLLDVYLDEFLFLMNVLTLLVNKMYSIFSMMMSPLMMSALLMQSLSC